MIRSAPILVALASVACVGGGGALSQSLETQDSAQLSNEGVGSSTEDSRRSNETVGSSTDSAQRNGVESSPTGGGFDCSGAYLCSLNGRRSNDPLFLTSAGGGCTLLDDDGDESATLAPDGTIVQKGRVIATWSRSGTGFTLTVQQDDDGESKTTTLACERTAGSPPEREKKDDETPAPPRPGG